jgi:hypothetical protein
MTKKYGVELVAVILSFLALFCCALAYHEPLDTGSPGEALTSSVRTFPDSFLQERGLYELMSRKA